MHRQTGSLSYQPVRACAHARLIRCQRVHARALEFITTSHCQLFSTHRARHQQTNHTPYRRYTRSQQAQHTQHARGRRALSHNVSRRRSSFSRRDMGRLHAARSAPVAALSHRNSGVRQSTKVCVRVMCGWEGGAGVSGVPEGRARRRRPPPSTSACTHAPHVRRACASLSRARPSPAPSLLSLSRRARALSRSLPVSLLTRVSRAAARAGRPRPSRTRSSRRRRARRSPAGYASSCACSTNIRPPPRSQSPPRSAR